MCVICSRTNRMSELENYHHFQFRNRNMGHGSISTPMMPRQPHPLEIIYTHQTDARARLLCIQKCKIKRM